jgi:hypothetical protein
MATIGFKPSCLTLTRFILIRRIGTFVWTTLFLTWVVSLLSSP